MLVHKFDFLNVKNFPQISILLMSLILAFLFPVLINFLPPGLIIGITIAPALMAISWAKLNLASVFLIILSSGLIPAQLAPPIPLLGGAIRIADVYLFFLVGITLLKILFKDKNTVTKSNQIWYPLIFIFFMVLFSLITAIFGFHNPTKFIAYELRVYLYWLFTLVVFHSINTKKALNEFLTLLTLFSIVMSIAVILQSVTGIAILQNANVGLLDNAGSIDREINRSTFGGFQYFPIFCLFIALAKITTSSDLKISSLPSLAIYIFGQLVTFGRGVWAATFLGALILGFFTGIKGLTKLLVAGCLLLILVVALLQIFKPAYIDAVYARFTSLDREVQGGESLEWRLSENRFALKKIMAHPISGIGLGGEYQPIRNKLMSPEQTRMMHNSYLYIILKFGLLGILFPIWLLIAVCYEGNRLLKITTGDNRFIVMAAVCSFFVPVLTSFTQPEWMEHTGVLFFSSICGILLAIKKLYDHS